MRAAIASSVVALTLLTAGAGGAQVVYIPAAAHASGVGGTLWRSDVEVMAGPDGATVRIELLERGQDNSTPEAVTVSIPGAQAIRYGDVLASAFAFSGTGALRLTATSGSILVTSRTYNDQPDGTFGQFIAASPSASAFGAGERAVLLQLSRSSNPEAGYRTNLGFVNATAGTLDLEARLHLASGVLLGSLTWQLEPYEYDQVTDVFGGVTSGDVADGFAILSTSTAGGRFFAYASVVDNRSGDPILVPAQAMPSGSTGRLQPSHLSYLGAFRLPWQFGWGARAVTARPGGGTLLVSGNDLEVAEVAEVSIPSPMVASDPDQLLEATIVTGLADFGSSIVATVSPDTAFISGLEWVPVVGSQTGPKLYATLDQWYGVAEETHPTVWMVEPDGSNPRGPWHVGPQADPFHGNKAGDFLFTVPAAYADQYLDGRTLVTGKTRGAFHGSQGPTLLAFRPWSTESPSGDLDAVAMLWYRIDHSCASPDTWNPEQCDFPAFTMCDKWEGGAFVEGSGGRAIVLVGIKGLGGNTYGDPPGGDTCQEDYGYHCDPFERQLLFYDVDELGEAAQGSRDPWTVVPYAVWRPAELYLGDPDGHTCGEMGGAFFSQEDERLYVIEKGVDGGDNNAVVHVWSVL